MPTTEDHQLNQDAYRRLRASIDQKYPKGQFVAIWGGQIVADAGSFDEILAATASVAEDPRDVLVVQAGVEYLEYLDFLSPIIFE
jgi:hypothetical protein